VLQDKPNLLVIGARGFLGQHLVQDAKSAFKVFEADLAGPDWKGLAIDIRSSESIEAGFQKAAPDVVVLLAAISDIDMCESRPEMAEEINVRGVARVVQACARSGARLLFTSSAAVFDGKRHGYGESDVPTPVSVYGRTKALAEDLITKALPSAIILRLALVLGFAERPGTNAMLNKLAEKLRAGESVSLPTFEFRNPIDARTLVDYMLELHESPATGGVFHVGADEPISRFELGRRLAEKLGFSRDLVQPEFTPPPGRAPRGRDHFLLTDKIRAACRTPVPDCDIVIERAVHGTSQSRVRARV